MELQFSPVFYIKVSGMHGRGLSSTIPITGGLHQPTDHDSTPQRQDSCSEGEPVMSCLAVIMLAESATERDWYVSRRLR